MVEGVAEYAEPQVNNSIPYRVYVGEDTIKKMDPTFKGRPVYVNHVDKVDLPNLERTADGYVIRSFFNKADGKHWAEFIVVTDQGKEAIRNGWKLSNAYYIKGKAGGGICHGVDYKEEVMEGEYEHLAIVRTPRYQESEILTPEQFKLYNETKELELKRLANSLEEKKGAKSMFDFWKKSKAENSSELETLSVTLPKSKKEIALKKLINDMDDMELNMSKPQMCNGEHRVKVGEEEMSVNDLVQKHLELKDCMAKKNAEGSEEDEEAKKKAMAIAKHEDKEIAEAKKESAIEPGAEEMVKKNHFEELKKAKDAALKNSMPQPKVIETSEVMVNRGKNRYGSGK